MFTASLIIMGVLVIELTLEGRKIIFPPFKLILWKSGKPRDACGPVAVPFATNLFLLE
jgi:hypothetical protein